MTSEDVTPAGLICTSCGQPCAWTPWGYCSWECYDTEMHPDDEAAHARAYYFGLKAPRHSSPDDIP